MGFVSCRPDEHQVRVLLGDASCFKWRPITVQARALSADRIQWWVAENRLIIGTGSQPQRLKKLLLLLTSRRDRILKGIYDDE